MKRFRMFSLCAGLALWLCFPATALSSSPPDSLLSLLKSASPDTNRVNLLFKIYTHFRLAGDIASAGQYNEDALKLSNTLEWKHGQALCLKNKADMLTNEGKYTEAIRLYQKSSEIARAAGDDLLLARILHNTGWMYQARSEYASALDYYNQSVEISRRTQNQQVMAATLNGICDVASAMGKYAEALNAGREAMEVRKALGDKAGIANSGITLGNILFYTGDYSGALTEYRESLKLRMEQEDKNGIANAYNNIGVVFTNLGDYPRALEYYRKALHIRLAMQDPKGLGESYVNLGSVYNKLDEYDMAASYFDSAMVRFREASFRPGEASTLHNIGQMHLERSDTVKAESFFHKALELRRQTGMKTEEASTLLALSELYIKKGDHQTARSLIEEARKIYTGAGSRKGEAGALIAEGNLLLREGQYRKAEIPLERAVVLAATIYSPDMEMQAQLGLRTVYEKTGQAASALSAFSRYITLRDSIFSLDKQKDAVKQELLFQFESEKERDSLKLVNDAALKEVDHRHALDRQRAYTIGGFLGFGLVVLLAASVYMGMRTARRERKKSDDLLLNILPASIAEELKSRGDAGARHFDDVVILFTDFVGFTKYSEKLSPSEIVSEIDHCFSKFDEITHRYGIEKIKTIGDAYMAACGLPLPDKDSHRKVVMAALEIRDFVHEFRLSREREGRQGFEIRVGIHCGPVVAGIVGTRKFAYDIWGDSVNLAARMEQSGEAGKVNITRQVMEKVNDEFDFTYRGKIPAKNKGEVDMFFVERRSSSPDS